MRRALSGLGALLLLAAGAPGRVAAQEAAVWRLDDIRWGTCLEFLVEPKRVGKFLPRGATAAAASDVAALPAPLARVVADQPEFAAWTPAMLCVWRAGTVQAAGRTLVADKDNDTQAVGFLALAGSRGVAGATDVVDAVLTSAWRFEAAVEQDRNAPPIEVFRAAFGKAERSSDDRYQLRIGKTVIIWDGHPMDPATARRGATWARRMATLGKNDVLWRLDWAYEPAQVRDMVGAVLVQGKGALADALRASPIRFMGPYFEGGSAEITVTREQ